MNPIDPQPWPSRSSLPDATTAAENAVEHVVIIGAGWTGRQIAGQVASHGLRATLVDNAEAALQISADWIQQNHQQFVAEKYWPVRDWSSVEPLIAYTTKLDLSELSLGEPGLILECVPEQIALKRRTLQKASRSFGSNTIIASNSSYFTPSLLQKHIESPERYAHFHFHVPIWRASLVDVASGPLTSETTIERLKDLAQRIGQTPLVQRVENYGYVFNSMLRSVLQSALELMERGVATPKEIDMAWCKVTGMPIGPFGIMDQIGIDIVQQTLSHGRFVEHKPDWDKLLGLIDPLVEAGHLGVKAKRGFYEYPEK